MADSSDSTKKASQARGEVQVEPLMCKSCGLCAEYCPQHLMRPANEIPEAEREGPLINPAGHVVYEIFDPQGKCTGCGICATACPEGAVVVYRRKPAPKTAAQGKEADGE